ncbi:MAG: F0F1 ATP synthase subunit delta [Candidatus Peribacteraceae bacterium]|jgi:F0F1-type ATP synthase delta subunit
MKITPLDIARALIETCKSLPETEYPAVAEAALEMLRSRGLSRAVRTFPRLVRETLERRESIVFATLITPTGDAGTLTDTIASALASGLKKKVEMTQAADRTLLGGAKVTAGDERFDASVRGALASLQSVLTSTL